MTIRLNLGAGDRPMAGYVNRDIAHGQPAFPLLDYADGAVAEIRASHVLEHISYRLTRAVLAEWYRVLRPGGELFVAVPDFAKIVEVYGGCRDGPWEGYLLGGHVDANDVHMAVFDGASLAAALTEVGFVDIKPWAGGNGDCASLPVSLNLMARKPVSVAGAVGRVVAVMSVPRLGFQDNFACAALAMRELDLPLRRCTGVFWGQVLTRAIEAAIEDGFETILTIDYDSVYTPADVRALLDTLDGRPDIDALMALQASRCRAQPLITVDGDDGQPIGTVPVEWFRRETLPVRTGHFGLTAIRVSALLKLPRPWFRSQPDAAGGWGDGRTDEDISFWHAMRAAGLTAAVAPTVVIGHAELMIRWPGADMVAVYQHPTEFWASGKPKEAWR